MKIIKVRTAAEMAAAVKREIKQNDALIMAAAVADFRPVTPSVSKIKKNTGKSMTIELEQTEDILKNAGKNKGKTVLVGFSLETDNGIQNARKKLKEKNLDLIVLNVAGEEGAAFEADTNKVTLLEKGKRPVELPLMQKRDVADSILDRVAALL